LLSTRAFMGLCTLSLAVVMLSSTLVSSGVINSLIFHLAVDPLENKGILYINVSLNYPEMAMVEIPIRVFGEGAVFEYLDYDATGNLRVFGCNYISDESTIECLVQGSGELSIRFMASNVLDEALGAFVAYIDTLEYKNLTDVVKVVLTLVGNVSVVYLEPKTETRHYVDNRGNTVLEFSGFRSWIVVFQLELGEIATPTPTTQPTPPRGAQTWTIIAIGGSIAAIAVLAYFIIKRRRRPGVVVEISDYIRDDAARKIIKALKAAEGKGLTQTEIARLTGLPKSSVSRRIRRLEQDGYITVKRVGKHNYIYLTSKGEELARKISGLEKR
jgi:DNA-binding transcriptional ArsR family regulator